MSVQTGSRQERKHNQKLEEGYGLIQEAEISCDKSIRFFMTLTTDEVDTDELGYESALWDDQQRVLGLLIQAAEYSPDHHTRAAEVVMNRFCLCFTMRGLDHITQLQVDALALLASEASNLDLLGSQGIDWATYVAIHRLRFQKVELDLPISSIEIGYKTALDALWRYFVEAFNSQQIMSSPEYRGEFPSHLLRGFDASRN